MITFKQIKFKNFLSYGKKETSIRLDTNNITLIMGNNLDVGESGLSRNGTGKSSALQAIVWCLFGQGISSIKQDDFINMTNKKNMVVELSFDIDGVEYTIVRGRKPNKLDLLKGSESITLHSAQNTDDAIVQLIGMDYEIFMNSVLLTNHPDNFMSLKPAAQKAFIEKLLNINLLTSRANMLKDIAKENVVEIRLEQQKKESAIQRNDSVSKTISNLTEKCNEWEQSHDQKILEMESNLRSLSEIDIDAGMKFLEEMNILKTALTEVLADIKSKSTKITTAESKLLEYTTQKEHLVAGECPYCKQSYINEDKVQSVSDQITELSHNIVTLTNELEPLCNDERELSEAIEIMESSNPNVLTLTEYNVLRSELKSLQSQIQAAKQEVINPYKDQIDLLQMDYVQYDDSVLAQMETLDNHYKILVKLLTDSKSFIRKSIIDQYIPFINNATNAYLAALGSPHAVKINNDLTVDVHVNMRAVMSYGNLSAGEKLRVNVAINLSFRDFISVTGHKCNLLLVDEIFDSAADSAFLYNAMTLLKKHPVTTLLISHREELITESDRVMVVTKENGFSRMELA